MFHCALVYSLRTQYTLHMSPGGTLQSHLWGECRSQSHRPSNSNSYLLVDSSAEAVNHTIQDYSSDYDHHDPSIPLTQNHQTTATRLRAACSLESSSLQICCTAACLRVMRGISCASAAVSYRNHMLKCAGLQDGPGLLLRQLPVRSGRLHSAAHLRGPGVVH